MSQNNDLWIEKYRPKTLEDYYIEEEYLNKIKKWLTNYTNNTEEVPPFIILIGKPGIGKTTLAHLIYNEFDYEIIELNASDIRNKKQIKETFAKYSKFKIDFTGQKKRVGIIMDELDGISSSNDKGGLTELLDVVTSYKKLQLKIKKEKALENGEEFDATDYIINYKNPIICTCNILKNSKFSSIIKKSIVIKLNKALKNNGIKFITKISKLENILMSNSEKESIFKKSFGDYRQILYKLFEFKLSKKVDQYKLEKSNNNDNSNFTENSNKTNNDNISTNNSNDNNKIKTVKSHRRIKKDDKLDLEIIDVEDTERLLSSLNINDSNIQKINFCITNQQINSEHIQNLLESDIYQYLLNIYSNYINLFKTLRLTKIDINKFDDNKYKQFCDFINTFSNNKFNIVKKNGDISNKTIQKVINAYNDINMNIKDATFLSKIFCEGDKLYKFINCNQQWEIADYLSYTNLYFPTYIYRKLFLLKNNKPSLYLNYHNDFNYLRQELSSIQKTIILNYIEIHQNKYKDIHTINNTDDNNSKQNKSTKNKKSLKLNKNEDNNLINYFQELDTYNLYYLKKSNSNMVEQLINKNKNLKSIYRIVDKIDKLVKL